MSAAASPRLSPARDHRALGRLQGRLERWLERGDEALFGTWPEVSGWSPAQHLFHVGLANELSLGNVLSLVNETGMLRGESRGAKPGVEEILRSGRLPRGTEAPRFVTPPARVTRASLEDALGGSRRGLEAVGAVLERVSGAPMIVPHQVLGALDATRWLRFARVHTSHHLGILRSLARAAAR